MITNLIGPVDPILANIVAPVISGTGFVGSELVGTTGDWVGAGVITIAFQWRRDGVNIAGATAANYTPAGADLGAMIDLAVTATDDFGTVVVISNAIGPIEAVPLSIYAENGLEPALVFDPVLEYYRKAGADTTFAGLMDFTCSSARYVTNDDGSLTAVAADAPRIGHHIWNGSAWENVGILVENAATNLLTYSEELDHTDWTKSGITVTVNDAVAPDGTTTAERLVFGGGSTQVHQSHALTVGEQYTLSYYVKDDEGGGTIKTQMYDLTNGAGIDTYETRTISTTEWTRVEFTFTIPAGCLLTRVRLTLSSSSNAWLWGAQLELGPRATSYIKTTYSAVTRDAENLSIDGADVPHSSTAFSCAMNLDPIWKGTTNREYHFEWKKNGLNYVYIRADVSVYQSLWKNATGGHNRSIAHSLVADEFTNQKIGISIAAEEFILGVNGASSSVVHAADSLHADMSLVPFQFYDNVDEDCEGGIRLFRAWDEVLSASDLEGATT